MLPSFPYTITYTHNRNAYIKVLDTGSVLFTIPQRCKNDKTLLHQLFQKAETLRKRHQNRPKVEKRNAEGIVLFGEWMKREEFSPNGETFSSTNPSKLEKQLKAILYEYAKEWLDIFSQKLQTPYHSLIIRKAKSKRGSCSHHQHIMLNLSLVYLPRQYIQYVIAHEAAHLIEKNHSSAFWELVHQLFPSYREVRKSLKKLIML
jgi:predicted metal-dependent hydrolase